MKITTQIEYGLRCILYIARCNREKPVSVSEMARNEDLPSDYVEQLLLKLRKGGLINSRRGLLGAYTLARTADKISVKDVVQALEEPIFEVVCSKVKDGKVRCNHMDECSVRPIWVRLYDAVNNVLQQATLEMLLQDEAGVNHAMSGPAPSSSLIPIPLISKSSSAARGA